MDNGLSAMVNLIDAGSPAGEADALSATDKGLIEHLSGCDGNVRARFANYDGAATAMLAVGLIDPYRFSREWLSSAFANLEPETTVFPFDTVESCVAGCGAGLDLVIFYLHDPSVSDTSAMQKISAVAALLPNVPLVVLTDAEDAHHFKSVYGTLRSGAQGIIATRTTGVSIAAAAIRLVKAGGTFAPTDMPLSNHPEHMPEDYAEPRKKVSALSGTRLKAVASPTAGGAEPAPPLSSAARQSRLTSRQMSVLSHVQRGHANKTIAYQLSMSQSTVKVHVRNIMRKLGATNRTQAAYKAQMLFDCTAVIEAVDA